MTITFKALLNGSGTLNGYTPEVGTVSTPQIDGIQTPPFTPTNALTAVVRDGSGGAQLDKSVLGGYDGVELKLPDAGGDDQYLEVVLSLIPINQSVTLTLLGRAATSPTDFNFNYGWYGQFNCGLSVGIEDRFLVRAGASRPDGMGGLESEPNPPGYDEGYSVSYPSLSPVTVTFRAEFSGNAYNVLIDGVTVLTGSIPAGYLLSNENYIRIQTPGASYDDGNNYTLNLSNMKILSMEAGSTAGVFWTNYVLNAELP